MRACINRVSFARVFRILGIWSVCHPARGHPRLTAFFSPGAPSMANNEGSGNPRALKSCRKLSHAS